MKVKSYTDLKQSKKLAEILPLNTADQCFLNDGTAIKAEINSYAVAMKLWKEHYVEIIPCWSLAALLEELPYEVVDDEGTSYFIHMYKEDDQYQIAYCNEYLYINNIETDVYEDFVDACVEMICLLKDKNLI